MSENRFLTKLSSPNVLVFLLVVLALSAVFFGWKGWRSSFKYALISNGIDNTMNLNNAENPLLNQKENETLDFNDPALRIKDTDNDGLNDWDELNVYKTSPYISDTDSDGINDGEEIELGNNPLCAEGNNCLIEEDVPTSSPIFEQQNNGESPPPATVDIEAIKNISPQELRQMLLEKGYTIEDLNQLTDEQLTEIWSQAIEGINQQ